MGRMRFVVVKGLNGWGDRLQCVLQAIRYAKATGRWLVFDWRDPDWAVSGGPSLDYFIDFPGLRHFRLDEFLALYAAEGDVLSVSPPGWEHCVDRVPTRDYLYGGIFYLDGGQEQLDDIATYKRLDYPEDIVVYTSVGFRGYKYSDFAHMVPARWVADRLMRFKTELSLKRGAFDVVHLRGGSKNWAGGSAGGLADLDKKIHGKFPTLESYLIYMQSEVVKNTKDKPELPLYILSDSVWLANQWIEHTGLGTPVPQGYQGPMFDTGIFQVPEEELAKHGLDKIELNYEMLRDFALMLNARTVSTDGISLFSSMAAKVSADAKAWHF